MNMFLQYQIKVESCMEFLEEIVDWWQTSEETKSEKTEKNSISLGLRIKAEPLEKGGLWFSLIDKIEMDWINNWLQESVQHKWVFGEQSVKICKLHVWFWTLKSEWQADRKGMWIQSRKNEDKAEPMSMGLIPQGQTGTCLNVLLLCHQRCSNDWEI